MPSEEYVKSRIKSHLHDFSLSIVDWVYNDSSEERKRRLNAATEAAVEKILKEVRNGTASTHR